MPRAGNTDHRKESVCIQQVILDREEYGMLSSRHFFDIRAFWPGRWNVQVIAKHIPSMSQESMIRNKNNGFQLGHELSNLVYFWS